MKTKLILIIFLSVAVYPSQAQTTLSWGIEAGVSINQFPKTDNYTRLGTEKIDEKEFSYPTPILAGKGKLTFRNKWKLGFGFGYQMLHYKYHKIYYGTIPRSKPNWPVTSLYVSEITEKQVYHKIFVPLTWGYIFRLGEFRPEFYVGARFSYFLTGKYTYHSYYGSIYEPDEYRGFEEHEEYNPFAISESRDIPAKRFHSQMLVGLGIPISKSLQINFQYGFGQYFRFEQNHWSHTPDMASFSNDDFALSIIWNIRK